MKTKFQVNTSGAQMTFQAHPQNTIKPRIVSYLFNHYIVVVFVKSEEKLQRMMLNVSEVGKQINQRLLNVASL